LELFTRGISALRTATATLLFSGYAPIAPGTAGTAVTAVLYYLFCSSLGTLGWIAVLTTVTLVAVAAAGSAERLWGKDPGRVVIDEAAGYLVTVAFLPHGWMTAVIGFFVFRFFDIVKPAPVRKLEDLPGGWGVVFDDVGAGIYGQLFIRLGLLLTGASLAPDVGIDLH
jgi:phosphatidylglycerophosphatase A